MGRFKELVDTEEGMMNFRTKYNIPPHVGIRYAAQGEWYDERKTQEIVIPMIAFIEGGMTIPMGTLTRNYLRYFRLSPMQCAPNMFRVLGCIETLNERMNLNLTYHDINWIYNLQHLKNQGYYLKSRQAEVRMIQYILALAILWTHSILHPIQHSIFSHWFVNYYFYYTPTITWHFN